MKRTTLTLGTVGIAGLVTTGLLALPISTFAGAGDGAVKRDEDTTDVVLVTDEDDDDTRDRMTRTRSRDSDSRITGAPGSAEDTASRAGTVSRDRDRSRGDRSRGEQTRDVTQDGAGERERDGSADNTSDRSRNDTRSR